MKFTKAVAGAVMVQGLALLGLSAANANVTLTYTGNGFANFFPPVSPNPYTGADKVTASITLANPLGDNLSSASVTPLAFTLSDGVQTITDATSLAAKVFLFSTDCAGAITAWNVVVQPSAHLGSINTTKDPLISFNTRDFAAAANQFGGTFDASVENNPGRWTTSNVAVAAPTPGHLSLLKTIPINGTAANRATQMFSFDISYVDANNGLYYLGDRSNAAVDVVDTTGAFTGSPDTLFGQIGGPAVGFQGDTGNTATSGPNGVGAFFPCIFAADGNSRVVSFNGAVNFTIPVSSFSTGGAKRADEMAFDPQDRLLLVINNADTPPFGTLINVSSTCVLSKPKTIFFIAANGVDAQGGAEQPVWDPVIQRFYVSIPQIGSNVQNGGVIRITTAGVIDAVYPINFVSPAGLTLNPNTGDLLVGSNMVFDTPGNACKNVVPGSVSSPVGVPATCTGIAAPQEAICNPRPGRNCTGNALVAVPGVGGGDEVWFNSGDGNYYVTAANDPVGPVFGVIASVSGTSTNVLAQLVPTLPPVPAMTTGPNQHSAGTVHSIAASCKSNHVYLPLPANTGYPNCAQGCIAVYGVQ